MEPCLFREDRFVHDVEDVLVRAARVVEIVVVAQGEVAEFHDVPQEPGARLAEKDFAVAIGARTDPIA